MLSVDSHAQLHHPSRDWYKPASVHPEYRYVKTILLDGDTLIHYNYSDRNVIESIFMHGKLQYFRYDYSGNLVEVTDGDQYSEVFEYDSRNRIIKEFRNGVLKFFYTYDGLVQTKFDENGVIVSKITFVDGSYERYCKKMDYFDGELSSDIDFNEIGNWARYRASALYVKTYEYRNNKQYEVDQDGSRRVLTEYYPNGKYNMVKVAYDMLSDEPRVEHSYMYDEEERLIRETKYGRIIDYVWEDNVQKSVDGRYVYIYRRD